MENKGGGEDKKVVANNFLNSLKKNLDDRLEGVKSSVKKRVEKVGKEAQLYFPSSSFEGLNDYSPDKSIVRGLKAERGKEEGISAEMSRAKREAQKKAEEMSDPRLQAYDDKKAGDLGTLQRYQGKRKRPKQAQSKGIIAPIKQGVANFKNFKNLRESALEEHGYDKDYRERIKKDKKRIKAKTKGKKPGVMSQARNFSGNILKYSFRAIIPSFTLSMIIVYIYVLARQIPQFSKLLCPIGQEWVPPVVRMKRPEEAKRIGNRIAMVEKPFIGCFCALHLYVIITVVFIIYAILSPRKFALEFLKSFVQEVLGLKW